MKRQIKIVMTSLIMAIVILGLTGMQNALAYSPATVENQQQRQSNWCWATCSSAVLDHYGINASQEDIVQAIKGGLYNQTGSVKEMLQVVRSYGLTASFRGVPYYDAIKSEIDAGNPMETLIGWTSGGGHALVLDGYFTNQGRNYIEIMDPWYGDHFQYNYEYYKSNSNFVWNGIIGYFRK